jgi:outer membrane protein assembly factor BamB
MLFPPREGPTMPSAFRSLAVLLAVSTAAPAADWPVFRGNPGMTGTAAATLPDQLAEVWTFATKDAIEGAPAVVGDTVFVASMDRHLYAVDLASGKEKWRTKLGPMKASPAVANGRVCVGDVAGLFYAVDAATGKQLWTFEAAGEITAGANFHGGNVLFGAHDSVLYCLTPAGSKKWTYTIDGPVNGSPAVVGDRTFVAGCDSVLHVVDAGTGKAVGPPVDLGGQAGATAAVTAVAAAADAAYVGTMSNQVVAVNLKAGAKAWAFESKRRQQPFYASAAVTESAVVTGSRDRKVYALDRATGKELWNFATDGMVDGSPVVVGGRVYVGVLSTPGEFYVLDLGTGKVVQNLTLDSSVTGSVAVAADRVFVGTEKGTLYCLGAK